MENENNTPSDEELQAIVGSSMDIVPRLHITPEDGKAITTDAHRAVTDFARLMARAAALLGAGDADESVTLGYDHEAGSVYAEVDVIEVMRVVMSGMNTSQLERNALSAGAVTPMARIDRQTGHVAVRLFLHGE